MRLRRRRKPESKGTPAWLISFTDMITLLLSFFILLQSFAETRDPELFQRGRGGFVRAIEGFGIPDWLYGKKDAPRRKFTQHKHPVQEDPANLDRRRIIDADDEKIRRVYEDLRRLQRTRASDYTGQPARLLATPIRFDRGRYRLGVAGRAYLTDFAADLRRGSGTPPLIYVIGLAPDAADPADGWRLSARRAAAAGACLREHLPEPLKARGGRVDSWGAASAGPDLDAPQTGPHQTFIVLAMMEAPRKES
ncbi:MAG: flagellar motor protein MotB [Planctomycetota bacterium]|nr:flagellar motor protein MotB [Planctomycetota bacterium]